jgi:hypothetical protein
VRKRRGQRWAGGGIGDRLCGWRDGERHRLRFNDRRRRSAFSLDVAGRIGRRYGRGQRRAGTFADAAASRPFRCRPGAGGVLDPARVERVEP